MKLVLVRHGETEWNKLGRFQGQRDIALNDRGIAQAKETAQAVVQWQHSAVYSSPLDRTMQVAQEISRLSGKTVKQVPGLQELSLGDLEGVTGEEMRAGPKCMPPGGMTRPASPCPTARPWWSFKNGLGMRWWN